MTPNKFDVDALNGLTLSQIYQKYGNPDFHFNEKGFKAWEQNDLIFTYTLTVFTETDDENFKPKMYMAKKHLILNDAKYLTMIHFYQDNQIESMLYIWPFGPIKLRTF